MKRRYRYPKMFQVNLVYKFRLLPVSDLITILGFYFIEYVFLSVTFLLMKTRSANILSLIIQLFLEFEA